MQKNYFLKTMGYVKNYLKKKNYNINVKLYLKQIVESRKLTKTIITMKFCDSYHCQFQAIIPILNPLKISENQRFRCSDVFKGYKREKVA